MCLPGGSAPAAAAGEAAVIAGWDVDGSSVKKVATTIEPAARCSSQYVAPDVLCTSDAEPLTCYVRERERERERGRERERERADWPLADRRRSGAGRGPRRPLDPGRRPTGGAADGVRCDARLHRRGQLRRLDQEDQLGIQRLLLDDAVDARLCDGAADDSDTLRSVGRRTPLSFSRFVLALTISTSSSVSMARWNGGISVLPRPMQTTFDYNADVVTSHVFQSD